MQINYNSNENEIALYQNFTCLNDDEICEIKTESLPHSVISELTNKRFDEISPSFVYIQKTNSIQSFTLTTNSDLLQNVQVVCKNYLVYLNNIYTHTIDNYNSCNVFTNKHDERLRIRFCFDKNDTNQNFFEFKIRIDYPNLYKRNCWPFRPQLARNGNTYILEYASTTHPIPTTARAFLFILNDDNIYSVDTINFETATLTTQMNVATNTGTFAQFTRTVFYSPALVQLLSNPRILACITFETADGSKYAIYSNALGFTAYTDDEFDDVIVYDECLCVRPLDSYLFAAILDLDKRNLDFSDIERDGVARITLQAKLAGINMNYVDVETYSTRLTKFVQENNNVVFNELIYYNFQAHLFPDYRDYITSPGLLSASLCFHPCVSNPLVRIQYRKDSDCADCRDSGYPLVPFIPSPGTGVGAILFSPSVQTATSSQRIGKNHPEPA
jgi:hypothetical protein